MLLSRPSGHVGADLRQQAQRRVRHEAIDLGEVDPTGEVMEGVRMSNRGALSRVRGVRWPGEPAAGRPARRAWGEGVDVGFDGPITGGELGLAHVKEIEILLQDEEMFGAIVARQRGDDRGFRGVAAMVPMLRETGRIPLAATMSRTIRRPVTPVMSLTTTGSCTFISTSAFCIRWV